MGRGKKYQPEQVLNLLRQIEAAIASGKTTAQASKEVEIAEQTYFRWRKKYGDIEPLEGTHGEILKGDRIILPVGFTTAIKQILEGW